MNVPVTLDLKYTTITQTIAELGKKYRLNIVTDALPDDNVAVLHLTDIPLRDALLKISAAYAREVHIIDGVIVFRVHNWYVLRDEKSLDYVHKWTKEGTTDAQYPQFDNNKTQHLLTINAIDSTLGQLLQKFSDVTDWTVIVPPSRRSDRFSATINGTTPGQFLEAITYLLNARQIVTIDQTDAQRDLEKKLMAADAYGHKDEREKISDALREKLTPLLSDTQKAAIAKGEQVTLLISSLPANVQKDAISYVNFVCDRLQGQNSGFAVDRTRTSEFSVVFMPKANAPGGAFGVNGYGPDGGIVLF